MTIFNSTAQNSRSQFNSYQSISNNKTTQPRDQMRSHTQMYREPVSNSSLLGASKTKVSSSPFASLRRTVSDFFRTSGLSELVTNVVAMVRSFFSTNAPLPSTTHTAEFTVTPQLFSSNYTTTQYVGYVDGKQISAELVASNYIKDKHGNPIILQRDAMMSFENALSVYRDIHVTSSFRTYEEQSQLYQSYLNGNNPYIAAKPGHSKHQSGFALDISRHRGNQERIHAAMSQAGFQRPFPKIDPVHWVYIGPISSGRNPVVWNAER